MSVGASSPMRAKSASRRWASVAASPVSCAAALATLDLIEHGYLANAAEVGQYTLDALEEIKARHPSIGDVRGKGLMIGVELVKDPRSKEPAVAETSRVMELCKDDGVLIGKGGYFNNVLRLTPPLVIGKDDVQRALKALDRAFTAVEKTLVPA